MDMGVWFTLVEFIFTVNMLEVVLCAEFRELHKRGSGSHNGIQSNGWDTHDSLYVPLIIHLFPPNINQIFPNMERDIYINYTVNTDTLEYNGSSALNDNVTYVATIISQDPHLVRPLLPDYGLPENETKHTHIFLRPNKSSVFTLEALCVGHASLVIRVTAFPGDLSEYDLDATLLTRSEAMSLQILQYRVTVIRKLRFVDTVFDWAMAVIAMLNSFSIGCTTDWPSIRMHLRHPVSLLLTACCQLLLLPTIALAIAKVLNGSAELSLGLFYIACVPGGGMGHVLVSIIDGDRALSVAINSMTILVTIGTAPLWIFMMGRFLSNEGMTQKLYLFVLWLVITAVAHGLGTLLRHLSSKVADAYLNWFAKPFLLLYSILLITIGVYTNMYMFTVMYPSIMIAAAMLPLTGYLSGTLVAFISRQESAYKKTIATESTMCNCLLVLVMVRFSLPQPDSDVASALPIWVLFMSPVPIIINGMIKKAKRAAWEKCAKRREKKYRHFSIVSSLLNVTNITSLSAATSPKLVTPIEETNTMNLIDEKITVV